MTRPQKLPLDERQPSAELPARSYRVNAAAALLGLSRSTVYRLVRDGELEAVRLPGMGAQNLRIPAASLRAFQARSQPERPIQLQRRRGE